VGHSAGGPGGAGDGGGGGRVGGRVGGGGGGRGGGGGGVQQPQSQAEQPITLQLESVQPPHVNGHTQQFCPRRMRDGLVSGASGASPSGSATHATAHVHTRTPMIQAMAFYGCCVYRKQAAMGEVSQPSAHTPRNATAVTARPTSKTGQGGGPRGSDVPLHAHHTNSPCCAQLTLRLHCITRTHAGLVAMREHAT
jgi:hypothetical protein